MTTCGEVQQLCDRTRRYLEQVLLPFWIERSPDLEHGGFLTYFDRSGRPTGEGVKTFLMQARMLFAMSRAHRAGYGGGRCRELAEAAVDFISKHYWDERHGGWFWIADRSGRPTVTQKIGYGQCFGMYAFGEYYLATGDERGRDAMERTWAVVEEHMVDQRHGGYFEIMQRDWRPARPGRYGGDRKSFDVHMHMMEALTAVLEVTGRAVHRRRLVEVIELILDAMVEPDRGTGGMQFALDFTPLPAIRFAVEWGSDEDPANGAATPLGTTSYGHNVEFAWLLLHAADVLGRPRTDFAAPCRRLVDHCLEFGVDREFGGVCIEGPVAGPPTNAHKQFWQHAEVLVGLLDAWSLFGESRYWDGFRCVYDFVFEKFVDRAGGGEWFALLDSDGTPLWDYQGHAWKISYHTVRSMVEVVRRLEAALSREPSG